MALDKQINTALLLNLKLKSKILAFIIGFILLVQIVTITIIYFNTTLFQGTIPLKLVILGPTLLSCFVIAEIYSWYYCNKLLLLHRDISKRIAYATTFVEVTFPSIIILFAGAFSARSSVLPLSAILNSPPSYIYFLMILLSTLMLDLKLCIYSGIVAASEFLIISMYFLHLDPYHLPLDIPNNLIKVLLMVICGIVAGLVSKKIKEAVLSALESKDALINKLDTMVKEKTVEIEFQKEELIEKNKNITDSINYARMIQKAILPKDEFIRAMFPHSFVLYKPKDIVSGDFYWAAVKDGKKIIAAVDCTGHGVPGAFMSMVGSSLMNEIVNEKHVTGSSDILNQLRDRLIKTLQQTGTAGENRDGMDIGLCVVDGMTLHFSGANNPLYLIRNSELIEIKGDKQPIGIHSGNKEPFTSKEIALQKGDRFYILTDGFADQFGGPNNKKFMYKKLQDLLMQVNSKDPLAQKQSLDDAFMEWKGSLEQVDDVLIIGVEV